LNGTYRGNYLLTEQNQVNKGRVDIDETEGWFVELDFHYDNEPKFKSTSYNLPVMIKTPEFEPANMNNSAYDFVRKDLNQLCNLMASKDFPESGYRDLIDIESFVKYFMVAIITGIGDFSGPGSVYFYKDKGGKICGGPLWDFDTNFGFSWLSEPVYIVNAPDSKYAANKYPFLEDHSFFLRFFQDPVFLVSWKEVWDKHFADISSMTQFIDNMANKIRKSAIENYKITWLDYPVDFDHWIEELKKYADTRVKYLDGQYKEMIVLHIDEIQHHNPLKAWIRNGLLHVSGLVAGEILSIYTATGALVCQKIATSDEANVSLPAAGIYIVHSGNSAVKVVFY
jgi:hypothetical protein